MSGNPYNSVLRSGFTRRLWLIISVAMCIPVALGSLARWFDAEERRASLQNQELAALSRDKASTLVFNGREVPANFARGLEGRYLVVLDDAGTARFSSSPVPDELVELFARRATHAVDAPGGTTILAWFASGREWRGAMTHVPPLNEGDPSGPSTVVAFAPERASGRRSPSSCRARSACWRWSCCCRSRSPPWSPNVTCRRCAPARGSARLRERSFETLPRQPVDEFAPLEREFNLTSLSLHADWRAFEVLGEVDRALLAASEIDRALDIVLPKFRELTRSQCVGVILLDPTAHSHGRLFTAALGADELPVQRVTFDRRMIATVREAPEGSPSRASRNPGTASCVRCATSAPSSSGCGRCSTTSGLSAMLIVGYHGEPARDPGDRRLRRGLRRAPARRVVEQRARRAPVSPGALRSAHPTTNRALFRDRLAQELAAAASGLTRGALMYVDLDHFKRVNDTLGHSAGDQLLSIVAHRLKACTKEGRHRRAPRWRRVSRCCCATSATARRHARSPTA
jgi:hypothetical protein